MSADKHVPKVGDKVAIVGSRRIGTNTPAPALVTKVCKRYVVVGDRRFNLPDLREQRAEGRSNWGSIPDRIEPAHASSPAPNLRARRQ